MTLRSVCFALCCLAALTISGVVLAAPEGDQQPDLLVKAVGDDEYLGDNVYNTMFNITQAVTQSTPAGGTARFLLKIQNDSAGADDCTLLSDRSDDDWTVAYYDAEVGGNDITYDVTFGGGWNTGIIDAAGERVVRVEVTPRSGLAGDASYTLTSCATSNSSYYVDYATLTTNVTAVRKPDQMIRTSAETLYTGNDVYNGNGTGQTKALSVNVGTGATFVMRVQNDGNASESIGVGGMSAPPGWSIRYFTGAGEITAQATVGLGYLLGPLAPGASANYWVTITPGSAAVAGNTLGLMLYATSDSDQTTRDVVRANVTLAATCKPDAQVRTSAEAVYTGDNVYTLDGTGQSKALSVGLNTAATYVFKLQNDGNAGDRLRVTGPAGADGWTVKYFTGTGEITPDITGFGWYSPTLAKGASATLWVTVTPTASALAGSTRTVAVTATSVGDATKVDVVKTVTTFTGACKPDLQIRTSAETTYTGDNVYNLDGTGQSKALPFTGTAVTYLCKLQNDGNAADKYTVTGTAGGSGWTVRYYASGVGEITAQVTGAGWTSPAVAKAAATTFWVTISADSGVAAGAAKSLLITATSQGDGTKKDAVKATTTKQ